MFPIKGLFKFAILISLYRQYNKLLTGSNKKAYEKTQGKN
jgi:hypothetical protein